MDEPPTRPRFSAAPKGWAGPWVDTPEHGDRVLMPGHCASCGERVYLWMRPNQWHWGNQYAPHRPHYCG